MLPDKKIDSLDSHLEQFKLQDRGRQSDLNILLTEYSQLLNAYKVLKRAHEETITNAISKPVSVATSNVVAATQSRDSYILVLVDGNDYIFNDEFISEKEEGGMRAARKLNDAIDKYLDENVPKALSRRVIVRIYANVTNLSKQLGKLKLTGLEKRSVADFTAGFTRAMGLFDFTDTLDDEGTKFKIREQFKIASEDAACSHILFAACNDPAYLSSLLSYNGAREKITLIQGSKWNPEFHQFNFEVTQFPTVFSWSGIPSAPPADKSAPPTPAKSKAPMQQPIMKPASLALHKESWRRNDSASIAESVSGHLALVPTAVQSFRRDSWRRNAPASATESAFGDSSPEETNDLIGQEPESNIWDSTSPHDQAPQSVVNGLSGEETVCRFFQKGYCRREGACKFQHVQSLDGPGNGSQISKPLLSPTVQSISGASSAQAPAASPQRSESLLKDRAGISSCLPQQSEPGFIHLNKFAQRLDPYMPEPTPEDWKMYNSRCQKSKPCNAYQLDGNCTAYNCRYDHSELEPQIMRVLEYVVKRIPCSRKGECRKAHCTHGHLCQKEDCAKPKGSGSKRCKFRWDMHYAAEECRPESMVPVEEEEEERAETVLGDEASGLNVDDLVPMEQVDLLW